MATEMKIVSQYFSTFEQIELAPDARIESDGQQINAIYPSDADTVEYVLTKLHSGGDGGSVDVPNNSIIASISGNYVHALVPRSEYHAE